MITKPQVTLKGHSHCLFAVPKGLQPSILCELGYDSEREGNECLGPGGPLEWQEGVSGSSMDSQKAP